MSLKTNQSLVVLERALVSFRISPGDSRVHPGWEPVVSGDPDLPQVP